MSGELVTGLKHNPDNIAEVFHKLAPFFKLYSVYAYDYTQVLNLLQVIIEYYESSLIFNWNIGLFKKELIFPNIKTIDY